MLGTHAHLVFSCPAQDGWEIARAALGIPASPDSARPHFRLFVGDVVAAADREFLHALGVTHVVNCGVADLEPHDHTPHPGLRYTCVRTSDSHFAPKPAKYGTVDEAENPTSQWPAAISHLREARAAGTAALVHCIAGANRSVTTAAVFLTVEGLVPTFAEAVKTLKAARPCAAPMATYRAWGAAACASWPPRIPSSAAGEGEMEVSVVPVPGMAKL